MRTAGMQTPDGNWSILTATKNGGSIAIGHSATSTGLKMNTADLIDHAPGKALESESPAENSNRDCAKMQQILDGARKVFLSEGFDAATMNDIARVAGVSK